MANDDISRKKAPKRDVIEIVKAGQWGDLEYRHRLSCGHVEVRKRVAPAKQMACTWCVVAVEKEKDLRTLVAPQPVRQVLVDVTDIIDDQNDDLAAEESASRIQAGLSAALRVPLDAIDVVLGDEDGQLQLAYVVVFLTAKDAARLAKGSDPIIDIS
jgi:hypothetical protein